MRSPELIVTLRLCLLLVQLVEAQEQLFDEQLPATVPASNPHVFDSNAHIQQPLGSDDAGNTYTVRDMWTAGGLGHSMNQTTHPTMLLSEPINVDQPSMEYRGWLDPTTQPDAATVTWSNTRLRVVLQCNHSTALNITASHVRFVGIQ